MLVLESDAFSGPLKPPEETGESPIFKALIAIDGVEYPCYVKPLPDYIRCPVTERAVTNRELANEIIGHVLAKACGFRVADPAGLIVLGAEQIPQNLHPQLSANGMAPLQDSYFCWFGRDMEYPSLKQRHLDGITLPAFVELRVRRLLAGLSKHPEISRIIAFDQWLLNPDRNIGNLIQYAGSDLALVDHSKLLVFPNWSPGSVGTDRVPYANKLRNGIDLVVPRWSDALPNKSARVLAYNGFAVSFRNHGKEALRTILLRLFSADDVEAILELIQDRLDPTEAAQTEGLIV